ncbi:4-hydroxythreonine-4-phosphate dehydrogenase [Variibacter gotjawalensis]|uniref:4-hydroxythreonine-4-phosphate dehydrogenase n=1 Tax=Variibacter gotjawalensis TaxID=1333996 RepID=A0A0S3PYJ4_9BRAD|nr:4-hydroxythreonine-4-phosphate dehydrogenase PdxA [Variibacter gotjawalensis]NIK46800.1 4-hydroxythreonine-4-phosphate dehydrogenase [Variibacter gotjawalensis]RZS48704.1 4-hydroxythreonine-4-phosphate dehydrogenase [Variibacter gotjawalensis]BAT60963.1 4-hydroxythreonine-4-phosphate dehydrogenase [Variibacter gotjawalensis]
MIRDAGAGRPLAVTLGEPSGIGPDITLLAWQRRHSEELPPFYVVGDIGHLKARAAQLNLDIKLASTTPREASRAFADALPVVPLGLPVTARPGTPDATSGPAAIASIRRCFDDVMRGDAAAIVTNPIAKAVLYDAGFRDPGHTEYLARLVKENGGETVQPVMMLWSPDLAVVPITIHIPLGEVVGALTPELIVTTARIVADDLANRFNIARPRLALTGLNPHAGEHGSIGLEDRDVIAPAIAILRDEGIDARGPLPADTMFHAAARKTYDAALCMYHDQALIPIKTIAFDDAVNVTLGLPFVRTSPDHGTAFDIAGTGSARPNSFIAALRLAAQLTAKAPAFA